MITKKLTLTKEDSLRLKQAAAGYAYIRKLGDGRVTGYKHKVIVYSRVGGNEWSPARKIEQFTMYYN